MQSHYRPRRQTLGLCAAILAGFAALGAANLLPLRSLVYPQSDTTKHGISVEITCDDAQIDQRHRVTVTVSKSNPSGPPTTVTVVKNVPSQSHVDDVAVGLANMLTLECGEAINATGEGKKRKIDLPDEWEVDEIKTEKLPGKKWKETKGHLKVRDYNERQGTGILPLPSGFDAFTLQFSQWDATPLAVHLTLAGARPSGVVVRVNYETTYQNDDSIDDVLQDLGDFLAGTLGMSIEYLNDAALRAFPDPAQAGIFYVEFGAYEDNDHGDITDPEADTPAWTVVTRLTTEP